MDWVRLFVVEALVPVAWPVVIGLCAFLFRKPLTELLDRVIEAGPHGFKIAPAVQQLRQDLNEEPSVVPANEASGGAAPLKPLLPDESVRPWEDRLREAYRRKGIDAAPDLADRLFRRAAVLDRRMWLEWAARILYGSQIGALKQLSGDGSQTKAELGQWYEEHRLRSNNTGHQTFERWVESLENGHFISKEDDLYTIREEGKQLLDFLDARKITEASPY